MRHHWKPELPSDREDGAEYQAGHRRLFHAGQSLVSIVRQCEQPGSEQHGSSVRPWSRAEKLGETLKEEAAKYRFLAKPSAEHDCVQHPGQGRRIAREVVVPCIDRGGAEQRHDDSLHSKLQHNAEWYADREGSRPAPWGRKAECPPRCLRNVSPYEDEDGAKGHDQEVASQDDQQRQQADWAEAAQLRRDVP